MVKRIMLHLFAGSIAGLVAASAAQAETPPSVPEIGAPELAALGSAGVGVTMRTISASDVLDPQASLLAGHSVRGTRTLALRIWYPAKPAAPITHVTYRASLTGEPGHPPTMFTIPGIATADAAPAGQGFPVVVLSHGYNNDPAMLSWLTENLASKGYVVVAPEHRDPPITDRSKVPASLLARPLDIHQVLVALRGGLLGTMADMSRVALVGYSFGGYGVLGVAGARLDRASPLVGYLPKDEIADYAGDGAHAADWVDPAIRAVVAISPFGGAPWTVWGKVGVAGIHAPLFVIGSTGDHTVGYEQGPAAIFAAATGADRHLLTFVEAGHDIGTNPPPAEMRGRLWDIDWFEDPVWRKSRVNAIAAHFITAFLDLHLRGDASRAAYFAVPAESSDNAAWTSPATAHDAVSEGGTNPTWKGFVRGHQEGLRLRHLTVQP